MGQQFFFSQHPQDSVNMTDKLNHNLMVMEISNSWGSVRWLMYRLKENMLKKVDLVESDWIKFINANKIVIESYDNSEDFLNKNLKPLTNEG